MDSYTVPLFRTAIVPVPLLKLITGIGGVNDATSVVAPSFVSLAKTMLSQPSMHKLCVDEIYRYSNTVIIVKGHNLVKRPVPSNQ